MWKVKRNYTVAEVFNLRRTLAELPYHMISHNCHHVCQMVLDIVLEHTINDFDKHFEFVNSNFLPIIYMKSYLKDLFNVDVIEKHMTNSKKH